MLAVQLANRPLDPIGNLAVGGKSDSRGLVAWSLRRTLEFATCIADLRTCRLTGNTRSKD